ncbi:MAG: right-handed parallel beta-helix repeat-containing protein [Candidatus Thermoplasmatota archaeon]|nr:right-handed parallel beta-helix repeat-containing protein [Candidatus Thermoplasmatota archaeon]
MQKKYLWKESLVFAALLVMIPIVSSPCLAQSTFTGTILYVGGSGPGNYTTISEAVFNASNGDTVFVYDDSSPYYEHVYISHQILLQGEDKHTTIIDGNGSGNVITVGTDWVTISGFTIQHGECGIYADNRDNVTVSGNIVTNHTVDGIWFYSSSDHNTVTGNIISYNGETGLTFSSFSEHNIISENLIAHNLNGTSLAAYAYGDITGNSFEDNTEYGLTLILWCNENTISQNNFIGNAKDVFVFTSVLNNWNFNYWRRPRLLPKPILTFIGILPVIKMDWRPLLMPHQLDL